MKSRSEQRAEPGSLRCCQTVRRMNEESLDAVTRRALSVTLTGHPKEAGPGSSLANVWLAR